jgi:hypothetical protein
MKRISTLLSIIFLLSALATSAQVIYDKNFTTAEAPFTYYNDDNMSGQVSNGKYVLTHKKASYSITTTPVNIDYTRDFSIEATVTHISGVTNFPIGITFGGADFLNLYYFVIAPSGSFLLRATNKGAPLDLKPWTASTAIRLGSNVPNKLKIAKVGTELVGYINDVEVMRMTFYRPFGNQTGFLVQNMQTAAFSNLKVAYTDYQAPVVTAPKIVTPATRSVTQISNRIVETAYNTDFNADDNNEWVLPATDSAQTVIRNGEFLITRSGKLGFTASVTAPATKVDMNRDFIIETEATHYSGTNNYGYGIYFGLDSLEAYQFTIAAAGYYSLARLTDKISSIIPWTATDAVKKQPGAKNKLTIEKKGAKLNLYINDDLVDTYPSVIFKGYRFGVSVGANQNVGFNSLRFGYTDQKQTPVVVKNKTTDQTDTSPPTITITSPAVSRGLKIVKNTDKVQVAGIARDASGIFQVVINGIQAKVDAQGNFTADVDLAIGDNPLMVVATDMNMNKGVSRFSVTKESAVQKENKVVDVPQAAEGKFYALLIAEQDYKDPAIQSLDGPVKDAALLATTLKGSYTFNNENVTVLNNPDRAGFFEAFDALTKKITPKDNLLIFYAGHGNWDETRMQGYWYPSDAKISRRDTWITNDDLIGFIRGIKSKHTLLITDACFAGGIFKTRGIEAAPKGIQELYNTPSRKAMTSGSMKEVPDKSVFIEYLVKRLNENTDKYLPADQLYTSFRTAVTNNSENGQMPQFGVINQTGDEGGAFIFIKK